MMFSVEAAGLWKAPVLLAICFHLSWMCPESLAHKHQNISVSNCLSISKQLLSEVKESLTHPDVTGGFNCTDNVLALDDITENLTSTVWSCSPAQESGKCRDSGVPQGCRFPIEQCFENITADLQIYQTKLYNFTHITGSLIKHIQQLLKALNSDSMYEEAYFEVGSTTETEEKPNFPQRMILCKTLQAFKLRTITITRVMNYLNDTKL
ncbi:interleukin-12 subunit alpha [Chiloscyllium plagiosum]|uniref:interleukin-12 subunit alpha n=1 Tax=Chiloscyllium plagiosum TaxID=36176 RepID=UPI001CB87CC7|nr:interleukin-12 subunit alpha [Chiloscyllium plagiosum]